MAKNQLLFCSVLILLIFHSCIKEDSNTVIFELINETEYSLDLIYQTKAGVDNTIQIPPKSNYIRSKSSFGGTFSMLDNVKVLFSDTDSISIVFDHLKMITFAENNVSERNILNIENYTKEVSEKKRITTYYYNYTFTGEDYNGAVPIED